MQNNLITTRVTENLGMAVRERGSPLWQLRAGFRLLAVVLGALHAWAAAINHSMSEDGVAYLDMGAAYLRGDLDMAINAVWSPLYSWLLGLAMQIVKPAPYWEFPLVHLVNFVIYLGALGCFDFFWRQLMRYQLNGTNGASSDGSITLPAWAWLALGYSLFIWCSLYLIRMWAVTPDMCVAALVYLAAGIILRIQMGAMSWRTFAMLGVVLGFGYLAKAAMFPLAFIFIAVALFSAGNLHRAIPRAMLTLIVFLLVGSPLIIALSTTKGRLTFGETGKLTYAWFVNDVPYPHWQGGVPGSGSPKHPTRKITGALPIYEFGTPVGGTYPVAYDPSYWYEGVSPHFDLEGQIRVLLSSTQFYFDLFFRHQGGLVVSMLILYLMSPRRLRAKSRGGHWSLIIPAVAALGMYSLVYVEGRYIGAFVVLLWAGLLSGIRLPTSLESRKLAAYASTAMLLVIMTDFAAFSVEGIKALAFGGYVGGSADRQNPSLASSGVTSRNLPWQVADGLRHMDIHPGDSVAFLGYTFDASWARLARVKIVAEMFPYEPDVFWTADHTAQAEAIQAFAGTGAKAIVAEYVPNDVSAIGWHRIENTDFYIYILPRKDEPPQISENWQGNDRWK